MPNIYKNHSLGWKGSYLSDYDYASFDYEVKGKRVEKGSNLADFTYVYDNDGNIVSQGDIDFIYAFGEVVGFTYSSAQYFYRKNVQGDIIAILDSTGNVVVKYVYDAWGNHRVLDGNGVEITDTAHIGHLNPIRYRGYYYDTETGLYYLKTRYYDPEVGRFISPDSVDYLAPDSINGLNLYCYCLNNPIMYFDPNGCSAILIGLIIGAIVGAGVGFGAATYIDYSDDSQIFNGSVAWYDYLGATVLGGAIGAGVGAGIGYITPSIGGALASFASKGFTFGAGAYISAGGELAMSAGLTVTGAQIAAAGLAALAGMGIVFSSYSRKPVAPRNYSGSRKEAYDKAFYKGGKKKPIFHPNGKFGPHFHPARLKFKHWHYYFALLLGFIFGEN